MIFDRVKPLDAILAAAEKKSLKRSLGGIQLMLFGIGCIIGTGIFVLTAAGGPFSKLSKAQLEGVTPAQALDHPTWKMGRKVTIDSATLANKGCRSPRPAAK